MNETPSDDELRAIYYSAVGNSESYFDPGLRAVYNAGRVSSAPSREAIAEAIDSVGVYIPGSHAHDFIDPGLAADAVVALMKDNQGDKQ